MASAAATPAITQQGSTPSGIETDQLLKLPEAVAGTNSPVEKV